MRGKNSIAIGVFNPDPKENHAFLSFSKTFSALGLPVPEIYAEDHQNRIYLLQDLGDQTLYSFLKRVRTQDEFPDELHAVYQQAIAELPRFQVLGRQKIDYKACYPRARFDHQSMRWDLNYFKYYFLKLARIPFDEQSLEEDFETFIDFLLQPDCDYFLYRDFQSRNIMLLNQQLHFIDYQGGRRGALQYDIASLLYDSKADIPDPIREDLLNHYLDCLEQQIPVDRIEFRRYYYGYVLIRIMQAMGSYGYRGFYEKKAHFLQSIPYALENVKTLLTKIDFGIPLPTLLGILAKLTQSARLQELARNEKMLTVQINSFSYKKGIPIDTSGHGGGFVFDCRAIHNPGRYDAYKSLTGKDTAVQDFLKQQGEFQSFMNSVYALVEQSIEKYQKRNFTHLMINFGCTGGQHRSVYCAELLQQRLRQKYSLKTRVRHYELDESGNES